MGACCADARDRLDEGRGAAFRLLCGFGLGFLAGFAAAFADRGRCYGVIAAPHVEGDRGEGLPAGSLDQPHITDAGEPHAVLLRGEGRLHRRPTPGDQAVVALEPRRQFGVMLVGPGSSTGAIVSSVKSFGEDFSLSSSRSCTGRRCQAARPTQSANVE
jgi:hypothetical protein